MRITNRVRVLLSIAAAATLLSGAIAASSAAPAPELGDRVDDAAAAAIDSLVWRGEYMPAFERSVERLAAHSASSGPKHPVTLAWLQRIGMICHLANDNDRAQDVLQLALVWRRQVHGERHPRVAETACWRGLTAKYNGHRDLAVGLYAEALAILAPSVARGQELPLAARILQAQAEISRPNHAVAIRKYRQALALYENALPTPHPATADVLVWLGHSLRSAGQDGAGEMYLRQAEKHLRALDLMDTESGIALRRVAAERLVVDGRWMEAEVAWRELAASMHAVRDRFFPGFSRRKVPPEAAEALAYIHLRQGRPAEAWQSLQAARVPATREFIQLGDWSRVEPASWDSLQALRHQWMQVEDRLDLEHLTSDRSAAPEHWPHFLRRLQIHARINVLEAAYLRSHPLRAASLDSVVALLAPRTALIGQLWMSFGSGPRTANAMGRFRTCHYMYVVRPGRPLAWVRLVDTSMSSVVRASRRAFDEYVARWKLESTWPVQVELDSTSLALARDLHDYYIGPIAAHLDDVTAVIAEYDLHALPLEVLITPDNRYWTRDVDVSYVPSATCLVQLARRRRPPRRLQSVLALAPLAATLEHSVPELQRVTSPFANRTVLADTAANEIRLHRLSTSGALRDFDVIHIATHTTEAGGDPWSQALQLAPLARPTGRGHDARFDAREVWHEWTIDPALVTLSACVTARGAGWHGGEFLGLNQVLLGAGAETVLSSIWDVDDEATQLLMGRFYANLLGRDPERPQLAAPMTKAAALREARHWLRERVEPDGRKRWEHWVYWAGFVLSGLPD